jgi:hypothetical protein
MRGAAKGTAFGWLQHARRAATPNNCRMQGPPTRRLRTSECCRTVRSGWGTSAAARGRPRPSDPWTARPRAGPGAADGPARGLYAPGRSHAGIGGADAGVGGPRSARRRSSRRAAAGGGALPAAPLLVPARARRHAPAHAAHNQPRAGAKPVNNIASVRGRRGQRDTQRARQRQPAPHRAAHARSVDPAPPESKGGERRSSAARTTPAKPAAAAVARRGRSTESCAPSRRCQARADATLAPPLPSARRCHAGAAAAKRAPPPPLARRPCRPKPRPHRSGGGDGKSCHAKSLSQNSPVGCTVPGHQRGTSSTLRVS